MLQVYRVEYQRKIGNDNWRTCSHTDVISEEGQEGYHILLSNIRMSELLNYGFSVKLYDENFFFTPHKKYWINDMPDEVFFFRKKFYRFNNPNVSLRFYYRKNYLSLQELVKLKDENLIKYLRQEFGGN